MKKRSTALGTLGSKFFALMQMKEQSIVHLGELQGPLGLSKKSEQSLLKRLAQNGYILRLKRGTYLLPAKIPPAGHWQPNELYLAAKLMEVYQAHYYISGLYAFHHHGFIQQIPNQLLIYNDKLSAKKRIGKLLIQCIKTNKNRITGYTTLALANKTNVHIANCARTVMDAIYDWSRYTLTSEAYEWINQKKTDDKFIKELITLTCHVSNNNTIRRIGFYLEKIGISTKETNKLHKQLNPIKSWIPLNPDAPHKGKTNQKWRIINNVKNNE